MEHVERAHPLGVSFRKVVIDCNDMYSLTCQCIKEYRTSRDKSLSFTRSHFGDLSLVKDDAADKLDIIMDHIPGDLVSAGHPMVVPYGIISVNLHKILGCTQYAVEFSGFHPYSLVLLESACRRFHHCKRDRKYLVKHLLYVLVHFLDQFVRLGGKRLLLVERDILLQFFLYLRDPFLIAGNPLTDNTSKLSRLLPQLIIRKAVYFRIGSQHLLEDRLQLLQVPFRLGPEDLLENISK